MQVVVHNMLANFSSRQLKITTGEKAKSSEKLSTGYRINRSSDDAAGLTISEKMRYQIRGLDKCDQNIQDGISLLQVADGAMNEISDMLHRMKELTVQGLNDTNVEQDVEAIQQEINQLLDEIDSITEKTTFNGVSLLMGEFEKVTEKTIITDVDEKVVTARFKTNSMLPGWVKINGVAADSLTAVDAKMVKNNTNVDAATEQRTDLIKYQASPDDPTEFIPTNDVWTEALDDNYTGVIDFSGLASVTGITEYTVPDDVNGDGKVDTNDVVSVNNLKLTLDELVNTGFRMGCCTCDDRYGVIFTTKERERELTKLQDMEGRVEKYTKVYIDDLLEEAAGVPAPNGADIAQKLVQRVIDTAEPPMDHFTHYVADAGNPAKLVVYDFRDNEPNVEDVTFDTEFMITKTMDITIPAHTQDFTYYDVQEGLMIQTGAEEGDAFAIHLYDVSSGSTGLGLRDNVDILKKNYIYTTSNQTETRTYTYTPVKVETTLISPGYVTLDEHGEKKKVAPKYSSITTQLPPVTRTETYTKTTKTLVGITDEKDSSVLTRIDKALEKLSTARTNIGAQQNRLEFTKLIDNNTQENTQAAESRIRDTDMAEEMVNMSKHNILEQVGQSMLAQANQSKQGILNLLQ